MRVAPWVYTMPDIGYNLSFSINLQDLEQLKHSRKEDYYPLCRSNEICGSTINKQLIKYFDQKKIYDSLAMVYIMNLGETPLHVIIKGFQTDMTLGRWGGVVCFHLNILYMSKE